MWVRAPGAPAPVRVPPEPEPETSATAGDALLQEAQAVRVAKQEAAPLPRRTPMAGAIERARQVLEEAYFLQAELSEAITADSLTRLEGKLRERRAQLRLVEALLLRIEAGGEGGPAQPNVTEEGVPPTLGPRCVGEDRGVSSQDRALHSRRWREQDPDAGEVDPDDVDGPTAGSLTRAHLVAMAEAVGLDEDLLEDMLDAMGQCLLPRSHHAVLRLQRAAPTSDYFSYQ